MDFESVELEVPWKGFKPDAVARNGEAVTFVEFRVSHAVDEAKLAKLQAAAVPTIEVDLRPFIGALFGRLEIEDALQSGGFDRQWLVHPQRDRHKIEILAVARHHKTCPHGLMKRKYAPCSSCPCYLDYGEQGVLCTGASGATSIADARAIAAGRPVPLPEFIADLLEKMRRNLAAEKGRAAIQARKAAVAASEAVYWSELRAKQAARRTPGA